LYLLLAIEIGVTANNSVRLWGCTTLKIGKPSRIYPGSHRNLLPSFLGTDPWSIVINVNDHLRNGPGISQRAAAARTQTVWRWLVLHCAGE